MEAFMDVVFSAYIEVLVICSLVCTRCHSLAISQEHLCKEHQGEI